MPNILADDLLAATGGASLHIDRRVGAAPCRRKYRFRFMHIANGRYIIRRAIANEPLIRTRLPMRMYADEQLGR